MLSVQFNWIPRCDLFLGDLSNSHTIICEIPLNNHMKYHSTRGPRIHEQIQQLHSTPAFFGGIFVLGGHFRNLGIISRDKTQHCVL